jgi:hypothetical protein
MCRLVYVPAPLSFYSFWHLWQMFNVVFVVLFHTYDLFVFFLAVTGGSNSAPQGLCDNFCSIFKHCRIRLSHYSLVCYFWLASRNTQIGEFSVVKTLHCCL